MLISNDPDLPLLAARASLEINLIIQKKNPKPIAIEELAKKLKQMISDNSLNGDYNNSGSTVHSLLFINKAFLRIEPENKPQSLHDIFIKAANITTEINRYHVSSKLQYLQDFFIALSEISSETLELPTQDVEIHEN